MTNAQTLSSWQTSELFIPEQRLVIEYAAAVANGSVPQGLFDRAVESFGEQSAPQSPLSCNFGRCSLTQHDLTKKRLNNLAATCSI